MCNEVQDNLDPYVAVADGRVMLPTKKSILPMSGKLTQNAKIAYSFNNLKSGSLILIGQLYMMLKSRKTIKSLYEVEEQTMDCGKY